MLARWQKPRLRAVLKSLLLILERLSTATVIGGARNRRVFRPESAQLPGDSIVVFFVDTKDLISSRPGMEALKSFTDVGYGST